MTVRRLLTTVLLVALLAPACSRGGGDDDAYVLQLAGRAEVLSEGETLDLDGGEHRLSSGDTVRMVEGDAVLELPGDSSMLLRGPRDDRDATVVDLAAAPDVVDGDAVVVAGEPVRFGAGDVEVELAEGAVRVQRALGVTIAVYAGAAEVRSAGRELRGGLPALRQVSVPATGLLPRQPTPLLYDDVDPDPWDRRFLGEAIDLGIKLDRHARGFTGQLGPRANVDVRLLHRALPTLVDERDFGDTLLQGAVRTPGEALVGAAIVVRSERASFLERWEDVFSFRDDGAGWGLVALDQQVKRDALLAEINDAFGRSPLLFAVGGNPGDDGVGVGRTPTTSGSGPTTPPTTSPPGDGGGSDEDPPPPTVPPPTVPPTTVPPLTIPLLPEEEPPDDPPEETPQDEEPDVVDVVQEVVEDLLGEQPTSLLP